MRCGSCSVLGQLLAEPLLVGHGPEGVGRQRDAEPAGGLLDRGPRRRLVGGPARLALGRLVPGRAAALPFFRAAGVGAGRRGEERLQQLGVLDRQPGDGGRLAGHEPLGELAGGRRPTWSPSSASRRARAARSVVSPKRLAAPAHGEKEHVKPELEPVAVHVGGSLAHGAARGERSARESSARVSRIGAGPPLSPNRPQVAARSSPPGHFPGEHRHEATAPRHPPRRPGARPRRRGDVDLQQLPQGRGREGLRLQGHRRLARPRPALLGPPRPGLLGQLRLGARPGDDQPPLRPLLHRAALHPGEGLREERLPRHDGGRRGEVPRAGGQPAGGHLRRHRADEQGHRGEERPRLLRGPARRAGGHREGVPDRRHAPLRGGEPLPRRRLQPLQVPALPGRAPGLRPGVRHRLLRRRPRQLHVPALRPGRRLRPRLPGRQAGRS